MNISDFGLKPDAFAQYKVAKPRRYIATNQHIIRAGRTPRPELRGLRGNLYHKAYRRIVSAENRAEGLTARGQKRKNTYRPELKGLDRKEYHKQHMQLWRLKSKQISEANSQTLESDLAATP